MNKALNLLQQAIEAGLTFADCVAEFAKDQTDRQRRRIELAREQYEREGTVEIDDTTICSGSGCEDGDYVMAWVWVYDPITEV